MNWRCYWLRSTTFGEAKLSDSSGTPINFQHQTITIKHTVIPVYAHLDYSSKISPGPSDE
ncbi:hypothetical protein MNQ98_22060 [Paenibacillus sp. N3/727]|uniref:hypothetical protein n=1 Tax=Paenibacillus sp. N3/727 TaxID=2925845 RepID=UPI001F536725|nr:hypothetical protein [Paenibacillus sp. N3/727]UNK17145.1 hypothetical protein MNQ98_22060 [Paenibacillus sp. N3/727]